MMTNDILRRLRYSLRLSDDAMLEMLSLAGSPIGKDRLLSYFKRDDEPGYAECPKAALSSLLDGMILKFRGPGPKGAAPATVEPLDNNMVLKKLRIALALKEDDMLSVMRLGEAELSAGELRALFRGRGQRNYVECLDQYLRGFLTGLARRSDGDDTTRKSV
ncbi:MAG TPA: DUF1456 family protein [Spirochaetales bacterium]|nr:DUF1456 family protein [Spirochaetales bacterium]HQO65176.1 DUF1456 family protein [Spirochaetales bacterium]